MPWWGILLIVVGSFCAGVIAIAGAVIYGLGGGFDW